MADTDTSSGPLVRTYVIGLSGPSSSGKTTLARLLRTVINGKQYRPDKLKIEFKLFILHQDDFYKTDAEIPVRLVPSTINPTAEPRELQDWDCVGSLDLPLLSDTLQHVKLHGQLPPNSTSKEDQNSLGPSTVTEQEINQLYSSFPSPAQLDNWTREDGEPHRAKEIRICILDGFLLFPPPPHEIRILQKWFDPDGDDPLSPSSSSSALNNTSTSQIPISKSTPEKPYQDMTHRSTILTSPQNITDLETLYNTLQRNIDLKLFLPSTRRKTIERRANRKGYVTLEGFWEDPPGYVEDVVWANYRRDHMWMFGSGGDVDLGVVDTERVRELEGILVGPLSGSKWDGKGEDDGEIGGEGKNGVGMVEVVRWALGVIEEGLGDVVHY